MEVFCVLRIPLTLLLWVFGKITRPIKGFEHKRNPDGSTYSEVQQLIATYQQILYIIADLIQRGKSTNEILDVISAFS